jgi:hypothetical protein
MISIAISPIATAPRTNRGMINFFTAPASPRRRRWSRVPGREVLGTACLLGGVGELLAFGATEAFVLVELP